MPRTVTVAAIATLVLVSVAGCADGAGSPSSSSPTSQPTSTPSPTTTSEPSTAPEAAGPELVTLASSDGEVSFVAPAGWTLEELPVSYTSGSGALWEYLSVAATSPDASVRVAYSADYENVGACAPTEAQIDLEILDRIAPAAAVGDATEVAVARWIDETPDGYDAIVGLVAQDDDGCAERVGVAIADAWRFVNAGATVATLDEARAWLDEHGETTASIVGSFTVTAPWS